MFQIGDKVRPSKNCRAIMGDPEVMTITEVFECPPKYRTSAYTINFEEYELERVHELLTAQEVLNELETFTREEVYLVASRSVHQVINNLLTDNKTMTMDQVINSQIDTVKLF